MKVFLSWSKPRSQQVATLLERWIPCVLQTIEPWMSSQSIEDGELWFNAIQAQVAEIINGIICLTKENLSEPWILFEAGGLAKGLEKSRIFVLLIDLTSNDILLSPLSAFNHTKVTEDGIRKLMHVINGRTIKPINSSIVDQVFDKFWPDFELQFKSIIKSTESAVAAKPSEKPNEGVDDIKPILEEILKNIRNIQKPFEDSKKRDLEIVKQLEVKFKNNTMRFLSEEQLTRNILTIAENENINYSDLLRNSNLIYNTLKGAFPEFFIPHSEVVAAIKAIEGVGDLLK
jgi:hypothetical protein